MRRNKLFLRVFALLLATCMLISGQPWTAAAALVKQDVEDGRLYMSEVKVFYGRNADQAKKACEKEGFIFCNANLNEGAPSMDSGASAMGVYLGYKTTEDPDDAITDLTLLDMRNSHWQEMNYEQYLDEHVKEFSNEANQFMILVNDFREKFNSGSPNALLACDSLNLIYVDEDKPHGAEDNLLGNYLLNQADATFFEKFLQRGNAMVLSKISRLLCLAVSDYSADHKTWVDRAKASELAFVYKTSNSGVKNYYDAKYQDSAKEFIKEIKAFASTYAEAKKLYDQYGETLGYQELEGLTEENAGERFAEAGTDCFFPEYCEALKNKELLDNIAYQKKGEKVETNADLLDPENSGAEQYSETMTLGDYILDLAADETLEDHPSVVYPIIAAFTPAQRTVLRQGGISAIAEGLFQVEGYDVNRKGLINDAMKKLKDSGCEDGRLSLWAGVDKSIFSKKVAKTNKQIEMELAGKTLEEAKSKAGEKENADLPQILEYIDIGTMVVSGVTMILTAAFGTSLLTIGVNWFAIAATHIAAGLFSAIGGALIGLAATVMCALWALSIIAFAVSIIYMIFTLIGGLSLFESREEIDYGKIPDIVFDARTKDDTEYEARYDAVTSNAGKDIFGDDDDDYHIDNLNADYADVNAFQSVYDRWITVYASKSPAAGQPIEVRQDEEPIITRSDSNAPDGYRPMTLINTTTAVNINDVEVDEHRGSPLYVFFTGEETGTAGGTVVESGKYITKILLYHDSDKNHAANFLTKEKYAFIDANLTPGNGYTFLAYQEGAEKNALTDIRVSNCGRPTVLYGGATYGMAGLDNTGTTPYGMSLFATYSEAAGTPITRITVENQRLPKGSGAEPVCLFSGGDAVDLEHEWRDNIMSKFAYTDDRFTKDYFLSHNADPSPYKNAGKPGVQAFLSQDDPVNGKYIYFWPKEQFKDQTADGEAAQQYIGGFSYFLAGDENAAANTYGNNYAYMQSFAAENGFELIEEDGQPLTVMTDSAGEMTMAYTWRDAEGYPADTYHFDKVHTIYHRKPRSASDHGLTHDAGFTGVDQDIWDYLTRENSKLIYHTKMYFGVAYTYNPYRAITGVAGLLTSYCEQDTKIQYTGMDTPAGVMLPCGVSLQGNPVSAAGISTGIFDTVNMRYPLYTNYTAGQRSDLPWMTKEETEIQTHYLLTVGPKKGMLPLKKEDILFRTSADPGDIKGFVPICDLRTPGDYDHPMNFALDTTNLGSKYLYIYQKERSGGRETDAADGGTSNRHQQKKYVVGIFSGSGQNAEEAIANLYASAAEQWPAIASANKDINANPVVAEFDEIVPVDLSSPHEWYNLHKNDSSVSSLPNDVVVYGNESAYYRWDDEKLALKLSDVSGSYEADGKCAYIGVVRSDSAANAAYGVLKFYNDDTSSSSTLTLGDNSTKFIRAGKTPIRSPEGQYYLYYSRNSATGAYSAPITYIDISDEIFINGFNTSFTVKKSDAKDNKYPEYSELRMRADENKYIHLGYDRADLPYIESLFIGVGHSKKEAFADLISSSGAFAATDVNCNYNSYSDKWIAVGYRRTRADTENDFGMDVEAIRDVFLYVGDEPTEDLEQIYIKGAYGMDVDDDGEEGLMPFVDYEWISNGQVDEDGFEEGDYVEHEGVPYTLLKHETANGSEIVSLNEGNGGPGIYLYYTTARFTRERDKDTEVFPITNLCFTYGDISPRKATADDFAHAYNKAYYIRAAYDASDFANPHWESVLGVKGTPLNWTPSGESARRVSLNEGIIPGRDGNGWHLSDRRVYMYVDRADYSQAYGSKTYHIRDNARLPEFGYYSQRTIFGILKQVI